MLTSVSGQHFCDEYFANQKVIPLTTNRSDSVLIIGDKYWPLNESFPDMSIGADTPLNSKDFLTNYSFPIHWFENYSRFGLMNVLNVLLILITITKTYYSIQSQRPKKSSKSLTLTEVSKTWVTTYSLITKI